MVSAVDTKAIARRLEHQLEIDRPRQQPLVVGEGPVDLDAAERRRQKLITSSSASGTIEEDHAGSRTRATARAAARASLGRSRASCRASTPTSPGRPGRQRSSSPSARARRTAARRRPPRTSAGAVAMTSARPSDGRSSAADLPRKTTSRTVPSNAVTFARSRSGHGRARDARRPRPWIRKRGPPLSGSGMARPLPILSVSRGPPSDFVDSAGEAVGLADEARDERCRRAGRTLRATRPAARFDRQP